VLVLYSATINAGHALSTEMSWIDRQRWLLKYSTALAGNDVWTSVSAKTVNASLLDAAGNYPTGYSKSTIEKARGALSSLRPAEVPSEVLPLLARPTSAWNIVLAIDELSAAAMSTLLSCYQCAFISEQEKQLPKELAPDKPTPELFSEGNCYPRVWTDQGLKLITNKEKDVGIAHLTRMEFLLRMYVGHFAKTGSPPNHEQALGFVKRLLDRPDITIWWWALKTIAEPNGTMAESPMGMAMLKESGYAALQSYLQEHKQEHNPVANKALDVACLKMNLVSERNTGGLRNFLNPKFKGLHADEVKLRQAAVFMRALEMSFADTTTDDTEWVLHLQ
jgi:hypothetical protein